MVNIRPAGASCTPEVLPPAAEKAYEMDNKPNLVRVNELSGLDLEKQSHSSGRCGAFFLTSLFIELIDPRTAGLWAAPIYSPLLLKHELLG